MLVANQQPFITITTNSKLCRHISEKRKHVRSVDQLAPVMGIAGTHACADHSRKFSFFRHGIHPFTHKYAPGRAEKQALYMTARRLEISRPKSEHESCPGCHSERSEESLRPSSQTQGSRSEPALERSEGVTGIISKYLHDGSVWK